MGFVHQTLLEVGVAITTLFGVYDRLFKAKVYNTVLYLSVWYNDIVGVVYLFSVRIPTG